MADSACPADFRSETALSGRNYIRAVASSRELELVRRHPLWPEMLAVVFTNGSLAMFLVKADGSKFDTSTLPPGALISCVSWSPKGKQLVAGKLDGKLVQYKPDLAEAKNMSPPDPNYSGSL